MAWNERTVKLKETDLKGSRGRCLMLTSMPGIKVACFLNKLICPYAEISKDDFWMPNGFIEPNEARLGETPGFLDDTQRELLTRWWLEVPGNANTPNWDFVSTCSIDNKKGLVLIEAKAHEGELSRSGKSGPKTENGYVNHAGIKQAIEEANIGLCTSSKMPGWSLTIDSHYQLCNRFAWVWKIASIGVPVVLVYLGFLNTTEMDSSGRTIVTSSIQWQEAMHRYADGVVPPAVWNTTININGTPLTAVIRQADVNVTAMPR